MIVRRALTFSKGHDNFYVRLLKDGRYRVRLSDGCGTYKDVCDNVSELKNWVHEMASNNDIGNYASDRVHEAFVGKLAFYEKSMGDC